MELPTHILMVYGYALVFAWVLVEQLGLPLPATPILLAAGALSAEDRFSFTLALIACMAGAILADTTWFLVGRRYGHYVLRLLCKLSLEPTTCVRRTQNSFSRRRGVMLMFAKFIPGLGLLAPPVAGQNGMSFGPFLLYDTIGGAIWGGALLLCGRLFGDIIKHNPGLLHWVSRFSGALLLLGVVGFFVARLYRRRVVLKQFAASRLEPEDLKRQLDAGQPVYIVDLRHPLELLPDPFTLPGALHFSPEDLTARNLEIPRDRDVVLYCTCPSEATAARTAMTLHRLGIERVRPLRGGYDEWKRLGFPLDPIAPILPELTTIQTIQPAQ
jgi:membrane protein DedA with SNARE-associated domain/rhodanese-related sulfurtransferase